MGNVVSGQYATSQPGYRKCRTRTTVASSGAGNQRKRTASRSRIVTSLPHNTPQPHHELRTVRVPRCGRRPGEAYREPGIRHAEQYPPLAEGGGRSSTSAYPSGSLPPSHPIRRCGRGERAGYPPGTHEGPSINHTLGPLGIWSCAASRHISRRRPQIWSTQSAICILPSSFSSLYPVPVSQRCHQLICR
jgi:hypothetical protein